MPPEINLLIEKPYLLIVVLLVGIFVGMTVEQRLSKAQRRAWREKNRWRWESKRSAGHVANGPWPAAPSRQPDAADQLRIVMGATFTIQPLLNKSEARVFKELDRLWREVA